MLAPYEMFALFVDVMGVQTRLVPASENEQEGGFDECRRVFNRFRGDLSETIEHDLVVLSRESNVTIAPAFVAEFSDAAYVVADHYECVEAAAILLLRRALRHGYPLRGGIGAGTFSFESSAARAAKDLAWTTSSFFGSAVVTAYQAERSRKLGLRIFIHDVALSAFSRAAVRAHKDHWSDSAEAEIRVWRDCELEVAQRLLAAMRDRDDLSERAREHYDATIASYEAQADRASHGVQFESGVWLAPLFAESEYSLDKLEARRLSGERHRAPRDDLRF